MTYGVMARYMRRVRDVYKPKNILINCETTPDDLSKFVRSNWRFDRPAYSNDFAAFDQSQDGAMLQFEVIKAKFHNIPRDVIEGYIYIKMNAKVFLGTISIMRLSGEGPTFDANTECAIAYHHTRFDVSKDTTQLYAGDDSVQDATSPEKPSFTTLAGRLALDSKPIIYEQKVGSFAKFCGWMITPIGPIKDPIKLNMGLRLAKSIEQREEVKMSYAHDLKIAYAHGDALHGVLTEEEAQHHQDSVRTLTQWGVGHIVCGSSSLKKPSMFADLLRSTGLKF